MSIYIKNNKIFVEGQLTNDPTLIGLAIIDLLDMHKGESKITVTPIVKLNKTQCV